MAAITQPVTFNVFARNNRKDGTYYTAVHAVVQLRVGWSSWLNGDTIASVAWTVASGLTQESTTNTTTAATIWLSGGTAGTDYEVTCRITTASGRIADRSFVVRVVEQ